MRPAKATLGGTVMAEGAEVVGAGAADQDQGEVGQRRVGEGAEEEADVLVRLGGGEGAGVAAGGEVEAADGGEVGGGAEDVVDAVRDDGDAVAGRHAEADELVAGEVGDRQDAAVAAAEDGQEGAVPEPEGGRVGGGREVDLGVVDQGDGVPGRHRPEVAEVDEEAAAGVVRQLDLLPGDPGQRADPALADQHRAEVACGVARGEDLGRRGLGLGEEEVDGADQLLRDPVDAARLGGEELAVEGDGLLRQGRRRLRRDLGRNPVAGPDPGSRGELRHGGTAMVNDL